MEKLAVLTSNRLLLLRGGIEPNPGPTSMCCLNSDCVNTSFGACPGKLEETKKSFEAKDDESLDISVAYGGDCAPSDGLDSDKKEDQQLKGEQGGSGGRGVGDSRGYQSPPGRSSGRGDDDDEDGEKGRKGKEPEEKPTTSADVNKVRTFLVFLDFVLGLFITYCTEVGQLFPAQSPRLSHIRNTALRLRQLMQDMVFCPPSAQHSDRNRSARRLFFRAVGMFFGSLLEIYISPDVARSCSCLEQPSPGRRPPEPPDRRNQTRAANPGPCFGDGMCCQSLESSGSPACDDLELFASPAPPESGESPMTYGMLQDLPFPEQCTEDTNQATNETAVTRGEDSNGAQLIPPGNPIQLQLRHHSQSLMARPSDEEDISQDSIERIECINMGESYTAPVAETESGNSQESRSVVSSGQTMAYREDQMVPHLILAAHEVHDDDGSLRYPIPASELCDKCTQREVSEVLKPCDHKLCSSCTDDVYPPRQQQAIAMPKLQCPVCNCEVKYMEDLDLYPPG